MPTVFLNNPHGILAPGGRATNSSAEKIAAVSPRILWYPYHTVVTGAAIDPDFAAYAIWLLSGSIPRVIVPQGVNPNELSLCDGFGDPALTQALQGANVESYIGDPRLYRLVTQAGGHYLGGDPGGSVYAANDKVAFRRLALGIVDVPPGTVEQGAQAIAAAVFKRLQAGQDTIVRLSHSGGGLGNRIFRATAHAYLTFQQISVIIEGDQPELWSNGVALVEDLLPLACSPSVTAHTEHGLDYSSLQITRNGDYIGMWSPIPPSFGFSHTTNVIGQQFTERLRNQGYYGWVGVDLGVTTQGHEVGFEVNARMNAGRHGIDLVTRLHGPWHTWAERGIVVKSMDHVVMAKAYSFKEVQTGLKKAGLLATPQRPWGAIVSIPPRGNIVGILTVADGANYRLAEQYSRAAVNCLGDLSTNREDHPLFP